MTLLALSLPRSRRRFRTSFALRIRLLIILCIVILGCLCVCGLVFAEPTLEGTWVLNKKLSDDPKKVFKKKLRKRSYPTPVARKSDNHKDRTFERIQDNYWSAVREGKEASSIKDLRRLGTAYPLVKNKRFDITRRPKAYDFLYDGELPREVRPNPAGRVYSASGDELVVDTLGHTLSYWEGQVLVLEGDPPTGGKIIERFAIEEDPLRLTYSITIRMNILKEPVELRRVYLPIKNRPTEDVITKY